MQSRFQLYPKFNANYEADKSVTSAGWTAIHMASRFGRLDCVKKLIVAGSNLNARSYSLTTPLHEAACNNHLLVAKILILSGCEVDPTGKQIRQDLNKSD